MRFSSIISAVVLVTGVAAVVSNPHSKVKQRQKVVPKVATSANKKTHYQYLNHKTRPFQVNGTALPDTDFDLGESYAGTLSISSNQEDHNRLWFWFFPSENPKAKKEIVIWLNGGPGCSSLDGLFQENGPFLWQSGTYAPIRNPYSWTNLTNMIWIDQPVSTGLSPGNITVNSQADVAKQFMGFWKNFINTFSMHGYKVYITGESYAGMYVPYIANGFLDAHDHTYYNLKGIQINDPSINHDEVMTQIPVVPATLKYNNVLNLNETTIKNITEQAKICGYTDFFDKYTNEYPPKGILPTPPSANQPGCDIYDYIYSAAYFENPCFNIYHLTDYCPFLWDQLGFPSLGGGPNNYFNRTDVQKVLHTGPTNYYVCAGGPNLFPHGDHSVPSALGPLPSVIDRTKNVIIGAGNLDFLLFSYGSLITIQNMTWGGLQGFQKKPCDEQNLFVPYHQSIGDILNYVNDAIPNSPVFTDTAGGGLQGRFHTERGLTYVEVNLAGHMIPEYVPGAAYTTLEFLLGRIDNLAARRDFTTGPQGNYD